VTYSLGKLDDRGRMFVKAGDPLYEGMIIGIHSRDNDLVVNAVRGKQLTNFRVSGKEDAIKITPPIQLTLEYAVEFIADDELVEITPKSIRIRKRHLKEHERRRRRARLSPARVRLRPGTGSAGLRRTAPGSQPLRRTGRAVTSRWVRGADGARAERVDPDAATARCRHQGGRIRRFRRSVKTTMLVCTVPRSRATRGLCARRSASSGRSHGLRAGPPGGARVRAGGGGEDADLAHRPAEHAAVAQRPGDELARAGEQATRRRAQPLENDTATRSKGAASRVDAEAGRHRRIPQSCAIEKAGDAALARRGADALGLVLGEDDAAGAVVRVLDLDQRGRRVDAVVARLDRGDELRRR
jgi:hypothetical protein